MRFQFIQESAGPAFNGKVMLDGYDASSAVSGFTVKADVRDLTTVSLDVVVVHGAELDMDGEILIPAPVVALLTRFGWTAPEGAEVRGGAMRLQRQETKEPDLLDMVAGQCVDATCDCHSGGEGATHIL
jgi:hypothetical protein